MSAGGPDGGALTTKPANMTYEEAAAAPFGGLEALHFLRKASVQSGQRVLINGAGGSIGTFAVQLARHLGAEVTAVDSTAKLDMLRAIGADQVIDYTRQDFTESSDAYDVVFDAAGKSSLSLSARCLKHHGMYISANPRPSQMVLDQLASATSGKKSVFGVASYRNEDLATLRELIEAGHLKPVIDRCYPLEQIAEAHRYVETGQKKGNVVITV